MSCDVLSLEWSSAGRDIEIVEPVLCHLEMTQGLVVRRESILDAPAVIAEAKPRLLLISNQGGATPNFRAVRFASQRGVPVVTLVSEGMFPDDSQTVQRMWWGNNTDEVVYENLNLQWSQRSVDLIRGYVPGAEEFPIEVSGATGFDRYRLFTWASREQLLQRLQRPGFSRIVGFAGWTFCHVLGSYYERNRDAVDIVVGGPAAAEKHAAQLPEVRTVLRQAVDANPDVLFVLKEHPGLTDAEFSEFSELGDRPNVVIVGRAGAGSDINVSDLISASDLWLAYESTTTLEAWMLATPTALVNPLGDFKRSRVSGGSPLYTTLAQLQSAIDAIRDDLPIPGFDELEGRRRELEAEVIGYSDGANHVRAAQWVQKVLEDPGAAHPSALGDDASAELTRARRTRLLERLGVLRLPRYRRLREERARMRAKYDPAEREQIRARYTRALAEFHGSEAGS